MNLLSSGSSDTSTWVQVCLFHILTTHTSAHLPDDHPEHSDASSDVKDSFPPKLLNDQAAHLRSKLSNFYSLVSTLHLVVVSSFGILSRDPHRVSDDGAKGAANVGEGEEHRLL